MPDSTTFHPTPDMIITDMLSGYAVNVPAEWQDPNMAWWRQPEIQGRIMAARSRNAIQIHDALWAATNGYPEPPADADSYHFDPATGTYARTDERV